MEKIKEKTPFDESNELIKKFMKENDFFLCILKCFFQLNLIK